MSQLARLWKAGFKAVTDRPNLAYNVVAGKGGGTNRPWVLGTLIYEEAKVRNRGKSGWNQSLIYILLFPTLSPRFFCLPLSNSVAKRKLFLGRQNTGEAFASPILRLCCHTYVKLSELYRLGFCEHCLHVACFKEWLQDSPEMISESPYEMQ